MITPPPPSTRIRELRKERGMTLKELADEIGTTPQTVQRLETDRMTVNMEWLGKIGLALGVPPAKLLAVVPPEHSADEAFIDALRAEIVRARRHAPRPLDLQLAMMEASGRLAAALLECRAGLRPWKDVVKLAAETTPPERKATPGR